MSHGVGGCHVLFEWLYRKFYRTLKNRQTKRHLGAGVSNEATFGGKKSLWAAFLSRKATAGRNEEKCVIFSTIFDYFCPSNIKISNFVCLKESRGPH